MKGTRKKPSTGPVPSVPWLITQGEPRIAVLDTRDYSRIIELRNVTDAERRELIPAFVNIAHRMGGVVHWTRQEKKASVFD